MNDLAIIVMSCDAFEDVWPPFFTLFNRYWPDCPFPVYFCTDSKPCNQPGFISLTPGKNIEWSARLRYSLEKIPQRYVLFLQDDFFLMKKADNQKISRFLDIMKETDAGLLRIFPCPGPDAPMPGYSEVGLISKGADYRVSCQAAIWDKEVLNTILDDSENIWKFEAYGSRRADAIDKPFLSVPIDEAGSPLENGNYAFTYFCTAVLKGKWMRGAVELCKKENISLDLARRRVETRWEVNRRKIYDNTPTFAQKYVWYLLYKVL